jgi:hypothetical protein
MPYLDGQTLGPIASLIADNLIEALQNAPQIVLQIKEQWVPRLRAKPVPQTPFLLLPRRERETKLKMYTLCFVFLLACFLDSISFASAWVPAPTTKTDLLAVEALAKLTAHYAANPTQGNCTLENVAVRREW